MTTKAIIGRHLLARRALLLVGVPLFMLGACSSSDREDKSNSGSVDNAVRLDVGKATEVTVSTHCGYQWLEIDINGRTWTTNKLPLTETGLPQEPTWPNGDEQGEFVLTLIEDELLDVRAMDSEVSYLYVPDSNPPGCA